VATSESAATMELVGWIVEGLEYGEEKNTFLPRVLQLLDRLQLLLACQFIEVLDGVLGQFGEEVEDLE
jgi:hypothetical protein